MASENVRRGTNPGRHPWFNRAIPEAQLPPDCIVVVPPPAEEDSYTAFHPDNPDLELNLLAERMDEHAARNQSGPTRAGVEFEGITTPGDHPDHVEQVINHIAHLSDEQIAQIIRRLNSWIVE